MYKYRKPYETFCFAIQSQKRFYFQKKIIITILIIILILGTFFLGRQIGLNTEDSKTKIVTRQEEVVAHDIKKTLTSSGTVSAKTTENVSLTAYKYFKAMCVEEDDTVKSGENILQYTDGTYFLY